MTYLVLYIRKFQALVTVILLLSEKNMSVLDDH